MDKYWTAEGRMETFKPYSIGWIDVYKATDVQELARHVLDALQSKYAFLFPRQYGKGAPEMMRKRFENQPVMDLIAELESLIPEQKAGEEDGTMV